MELRQSMLRSYVDYLKRLCLNLPEASTLVHTLGSASTGFNNHRIALPIVCTESSVVSDGGPSVCEIFEQLPLLNELLWFVNAELREVTPCKLSLVSLCNDDNETSEPSEEFQCAAIFFHCLLTKHHCIDSVEVDHYTFEPYTALFCGAQRLSKGLRKLRLNTGGLGAIDMPDFVRAICDTSQLEELECDNIHLLSNWELLERQDYMRECQWSDLDDDYISENEPQLELLDYDVISENDHQLELLGYNDTSMNEHRLELQDCDISEGERELELPGWGATSEYKGQLVDSDGVAWDECQHESPRSDTTDVYELLGRFADFVRNSSSLRALGLIDTDAREDVEVDIKPVLDNIGITKLAVNCAFLESENSAAFSKYLAGPSLLTELTVQGVCKRIPCSVKQPLFASLKKNRVLQKLVLQNFTFELVDATQFSVALATNTTLQEVDFSSCRWNFLIPDAEMPLRNVHAKHALVSSTKKKWGKWWRVEPFVKAIRGSSSLRRLALGKNYFLEDELRRLLMAVKKSTSFRELRFKTLEPESFALVCGVVCETGTVGKVAFHNCCSDPTVFIDCLTRFKQSPLVTHYTFTYLDTVVLQEMCTNLELFDNITAISLHVHSTQGAIDEECAISIASYFSSTATLREVNIDLHAATQFVQTIMNGLSTNASIEKLGLFNWPLCNGHLRVFCEWLQRGRTLHSLFCSFTSPEMYSSLMLKLTHCLSDSYSLTRLTGFEAYQSRDNWHVVRGLLNRNASLVERAAHFCLDTSFKRCTTAFECVWWHPLVIARVQELASVSVEEARQKLEEGMLRLQTDFWQLAGVVKTGLCCHNRSDKKIQIDQLGASAWMAIRKFLKVSDIVDAKPKKERTGRKRPADE